MKRLMAYFRNLLRELSDESAYARYLRASGQSHSPATWRAFADRRYSRKYANGKCC